MERNIIKIDEAGLKDDLKTLIRGTVEDTLNATASCRESPPLRSGERPQGSAWSSPADISLSLECSVCCFLTPSWPRSSRNRR